MKGDVNLKGVISIDGSAPKGCVITITTESFRKVCEKAGVWRPHLSKEKLNQILSGVLKEASVTC